MNLRTFALTLCVISILVVGRVGRAQMQQIYPGDNSLDRSLYPKAYGILATEKLLYPVDMGNWPVKIDAKRQLFVDDYLLKSMSGLKRQYHEMKRHPANPVWKPPEWIGMPFYVMRDENGKFRLWYQVRTRYQNADGKARRHPTGYIESDDGLHWRAPKLGIVSAGGSTDNNYCFEKSLEGIFYEPWETDPSRRYKGLVHFEPDNDKTLEVFEGYWLYVSADGIHWKPDHEAPAATSLVSYTLPMSGIGDTSTWRWDPVLKKYICNTKFVFGGRYRAYGICESDDLIHWSRPQMALYRDELDPEGMQFYAHHTFNYESMWLGLIKNHLVFRDGTRNPFPPSERMKRPKGKRRGGGYKHSELQLTLSRDGRHFTRCPGRLRILPEPKKPTFDMDYPSLATGIPIRMGNELWFYYTDRRHVSSPGGRTGPKPHGYYRLLLATLRVDGFASVNAGDRPGTLVTRPLTFNGTKLFVNAEVGEGGYVKAALREAHPTMKTFVPRDQRAPWGEMIDPYTPANCKPVTGNVFAGRITWRGRDSLQRIPKTSPRLVFELKNAKLYSFWIE